MSLGKDLKILLGGIIANPILRIPSPKKNQSSRMLQIKKSQVGLGLLVW
jgi:hypothetical protein